MVQDRQAALVLLRDAAAEFRDSEKIRQLARRALCRAVVATRPYVTLLDQARETGWSDEQCRQVSLHPEHYLGSEGDDDASP